MGRGKPRAGEPASHSARLGSAEESLREAISEAHAMTKSLQAAIKVAQEAIPAIVAWQIQTELERQLANMAPELQRQIAESRDAIMKDFTELNKSLVTTCRVLTNGRLPSLPAIVKDMVTLIEAVAESEAAASEQMRQDAVEGKKP
jgi:hypothetical protein